MNTMTEWQVAEIVETCMNALGYPAELEMGGGGSPEIFLPLWEMEYGPRLHYATYAYEGIGIETWAGDDTWEESPDFPRLEIDRSKPIIRQVTAYLEELATYL